MRTPLLPMLLLFLLSFLSAATTQAQTADEPNEGSRLTRDETTGEYTFQWFGHSGQTYFVQCSDDLVNWSYVPVIETGNAAVIEYGFTCTNDHFFLRLRYTNAATGGNPDTADFDGDHVPNMAELNQLTDPLSALDTDGDQIPDDWEKLFGLNPASAADALLDPDGDGLTNRAEFQAFTDPLTADTDGDGFKDGYEVQKGSDPALASSSPLTLLQAQRITLQQLVQEYLTKRAANADLLTRKNLWDGIKALKDSLQAQLTELSQNTDDPDVLQEIEDTEEGTEEDDDPAESSPSTAIVQWRWMDVNYSQTRWRSYERLWTWNGMNWSAGEATDVGSGYQDNEGNWSQSDDQSGTVSTLQQARDQTPSWTGATQGWRDTDETSFTATGSWEDGEMTATGNADTAPAAPGTVDGETQIRTTVEYTPESFSKQTREIRIKRSEDGDQEVPLEATFFKVTEEGEEVAQLSISPDASESSSTVSVEGNPSTANTSAGETATQFKLQRDEAGGQEEWGDINGPLASCLPGQEMNIRFDESQLPQGTTASGYQWTITGTTFKDFTSSTGQLQALSNGDLTGSNKVLFYWSEKGAQTVTCTFTAAQKQVTVKAVINVIRPTVSFKTIEKGKSKFDPTSSRAGLNSDGSGTTGIKWKAKVDADMTLDPQKQSEWCFAQIVTPQIEWTQPPSGTTQTVANNGVSGLDNSFPYPTSSGGGSTQVGAENTASDKPGLTISTANVTELNISDCSFTTYVMFKPVGSLSCWVPLSKMNWNYRIKCTANGNTFNTDPTATSESLPDKGTITRTHPQWSITHTGTP